MSSLSINVGQANFDTHTPPKTPTCMAPSTSSTQTSVASVANASRRLPDGIYVPMLTFFDPETEDIDLAAMQSQAARLQEAGVAGLLLHGSNGEAAHLTHEERIRNIQAVVDAVRTDRFDLNATPFPILAGCGAQSVRETVELCREAASVGATHALILPPGYYSSIISRDQLRDFFVNVAEHSPIPILIYNFPPAAHGIDLSSDAICELAAAHPNIVGVKLTCGNTGKLARVVAGTAAIRDPSNPFFVAGGSADFILQGAVVGANGSISGLANMAPRACTRILELFEQGRLKEARELQAVVAQGDWLAIRYGFIGVKHGMQRFGTLSSSGKKNAAAIPSETPRKPCRVLSDAAKIDFDAGTQALFGVEQKLEIQAR